MVEFVAVRHGETVLEIGGGIGEIELELLRAGAERATNVELSTAYEAEGRSLLDQAGLGDRIEWRYGDVATHRELAEPADVVVLNRVVCCYPDMPALVNAAAEKTRRTLALSFPRDTWFIRTGLRAINTWSRLRRSDFRFFVHAPSEIVGTATDSGLRLVGEHSGRFWQIAALERSI
jgi:Methyltransferase domain